MQLKNRLSIRRGEQETFGYQSRVNNAVPTASGASLWQLDHTQEWEPSCVMGGYSASRGATRPPHPQLGQFGTDVESIKNKV